MLSRSSNGGSEKNNEISTNLPRNFKKDKKLKLGLKSQKKAVHVLSTEKLHNSTINTMKNTLSEKRNILQKSEEKKKILPKSNMYPSPHSGDDSEETDSSLPTSSLTSDC